MVQHRFLKRVSLVANQRDLSIGSAASDALWRNVRRLPPLPTASTLKWRGAPTGVSLGPKQLATFANSTLGPNVAMLPDMWKPLTLISRVVLILASGACACGGAVDTNQTPGSDTAAKGSTGGGSSGGAGCCGNSPGQTLLADCKPGFPPDQETASKPCRFFVGKTCYSTQDEACACVCPRDKGAVICVADGNQYLAGTDAYGVWCEPE